MDYELFHDESQLDGYWHGMLLVPLSAKALLVENLQRARRNIRYQHPLAFKNISKRNRVYGCSQAWLTLAIAALRSKTKGEPLPVYLGDKEQGKKVYPLFREKIGAKFILFCERDNLTKMIGHVDHASKVETTFRMGFKGGLHFLGEDEDPIRIERIHFDGHEHHKRHVDRHRIVDRIEGLRDYCTISSSPGLVDDRSSDHRKRGSQEYGDCQLLQLADLLIGSFRCNLRTSGNKPQQELAQQVKNLIDRYIQGYDRMQNSRWRNSFCMSECYLEDSAWKFRGLEYDREGSSDQQIFPFH